MPENKDNEERKNEFIDAAEKLFKENGIVETTISSIVKEMDVAKGLFYYYFKSKDDVIEAISNKYNEAFDAMMRESMNQENYIDRLKQFVNNSVKSFRVLHDKLNGEEGADLSNLSVRSTLEAKEKAIHELTELFEEGVKLGELTLQNEKYYADILISGVVELIDQGEATDDEIAYIIWDLIERAGKD
ncbi:MAG: TetR/AcrR family transcriptional regulator [Bulleidia sp.]|nr:TetR/AcrR family transcriptional regulator [Bulleidia sp.]